MLSMQNKLDKAEGRHANEKNTNKQLQEQIGLLKKNVTLVEKTKLTVDEQMKLDDHKTDNQARLAESRDKSKVDSREMQKDNDEARRHDNFVNSRNRRMNDSGNQWSLRSEVCVCVM